LEATMRLTMLAGLAGAALLINCGGDYCSNMESFEGNTVQRNGACTDQGSGHTFSQSSCESALANSCTSADQSALAKASSCLDGLPECTPGTETTFNGEIVACDGDAQNVTLSCNAALLEAGAPIVSIGSACTASGGNCSSNSDCCSGTCNTSTCG
jgi:hypothetical protein